MTEDRQETGLVLNSSVSENINISSLNVISRMSIINENDIQRRADHTIRTFNIKTPSRQQRVANLSGGNQQKVVLGRWALLDPKVLLLDEPTRGIDIGAKKKFIVLCRILPSKEKALLWSPPNFLKLLA